MKLSHHDKHLLAAKSGADIRTIQKWWDGLPIARGVKTSIELWAKKLSITRPEPQAEAS
jgi:hypothetical protein